MTHLRLTAKTRDVSTVDPEAVEPEASDELPRWFGHFFLYDQIGEGGMARIYLARSQTELGAERQVAVKQILPMLSRSESFGRKLIEDAKLCSQLSHGNIVQVMDLGREDGLLYIAMEYVEGFDLRELLRRCSRGRISLPIEFSLAVVIETLRALDFAHRLGDESGKPLGIVHRDVSPSNILLSFEGEVKLCDFGIARALSAEPSADDEPAGKSGYMSPEAALGKELDGRADVFCVGIILWELLAGRRLYKAPKGSAPSLERAALAEIPSLPIRGLAQETQLHEIVMRSLSRAVDERYASAHDMLEDLERYAEEAELAASPLRFRDWLNEHFGRDIVAQRRARERHARELLDSLPPRSPGRTSSPSFPPLDQPLGVVSAPATAGGFATHSKTASAPAAAAVAVLLLAVASLAYIFV